jgi:hypothetical protein
MQSGHRLLLSNIRQVEIPPFMVSAPPPVALKKSSPSGANMPSLLMMKVDESQISSGPWAGRGILQD